MPQDKDAKQDDPSREDAKAAAAAARDSARETEALDEDLDESFPASDAPSATRRSSTGGPPRRPGKTEDDPSEQPS